MNPAKSLMREAWLTDAWMLIGVEKWSCELSISLMALILGLKPGIQWGVWDGRKPLIVCFLLFAHGICFSPHSLPFQDGVWIGCKARVSELSLIIWLHVNVYLFWGFFFSGATQILWIVVLMNWMKKKFIHYINKYFLSYSTNLGFIINTLDPNR